MDFWARGAYHRARKIMRGPGPKGRISGIGMDGIKRKPKKRKPRASSKLNQDCVNYTLFCKGFGSCDGQECEFSPESVRH